MNPALELVNSEWWRGRPGRAVDKLDDEAWLSSYVTAAGFEGAGAPTPAEHRALAELRGVLRGLVESPPAGDLATLDRFARLGAVRRRVVDGDVVLEPVERTWSWVLSEIAASFVELVSSGDPTRIKVCANRECQWAFYDASKNHSRRWCGAATCGTADKVRRFRERQRAVAADSPS